MREIYPEARAQCCWVHKTANVLNQLPTHAQSKAKWDLREDVIWNATGGRQHAERAFDAFLRLYGVKYGKAAACLAKGRKVLLTFYDFPRRTLAEHPHH